MANDTAKGSGGSDKPPYVPYKTLYNMMEGFRETVLPQQIDRSAMAGQSGGTQSVLQSSFRFLGLTDANNYPTDALKKIDGAASSQATLDCLKEAILASYDFVFEDAGLDLSRATENQIREKLSEKGLAGSTQDKAFRFFIQACDELEIDLGPLLKPKPKGGTRGAGTRKPRAKKNKRNSVGNGDGQHHVAPPGMVDFPIPLGTINGLIRVPRSITLEQFPIVEAMLNAVKTLAAQNSKSLAEGGDDK